MLVLYGATTGRDGIGGASVLASQELGEGAAEKRPSVQVGDPFTRQRLIEVSLELVERGLVESLQDCGAAGLASALAEMARDGAGVDVHLDRVPLREPDLEPWEIMISESQERMVAVVRPSGSARCRGAASAGSSVHARSARSRTPASCGRSSAARPSARSRRALLTDECPRYEVEQRRDRASRAAPSTRRMLEPKRWIFEQYDHLVGSRTVRRPGLDAAVLRLAAPRARGLARRPAARRARPVPGRRSAVIGAALNVACAGGEPIGLTDCLNFGNPEKPEIGWELAQAIEGIARGRRGARDPGRLRQRLALQRDGRARDPADAGRRLRRASPRRDADPVSLAARRPVSAPARRGRRLVALRLAERPPLSRWRTTSRGGGLATALPEAAAWSGSHPEPDVAARRRGVVVAFAPRDRARLAGPRGARIV